MTLTVPTRPEVGRIDLSADLADAFRRIGDREDPPGTLGEGFAIVTETFGGDVVDVTLADMYQAEPTRHAVHVDDTVEHVPCVLDALIVSLSLEDRPIEIFSEPPGGGEPVHFRVTGDEVTVTPERATTSFGIATRTDAAASPATITEELNEESTIPSSCSVINAFPDSAAYARWADDVSGAAVMELDVEEMVAIARRAV